MSTYPSVVVRLGALAVTCGLGMAVATCAGTAWADEPTNDPGPSAEGQPAESNGAPDATDGPTDFGPAEPGPETDSTAAPPNEGPSIIRQGESPPVVIDSSGGLIEAGETEAPETQPVDESASPAPEVVPPAVVVEPVVAPPSTPAVPLVSPVVPAPPVAVPSASGLHATPGLVRTSSAAFPSQVPAAAPLSSGVIAVDAQPVAVQTLLQQTTLSMDSAVTEEIAVASDPPPASRMSSSGTFIGVATSLLAAALTPFFAPGPATPAQTPVLWAVLAWVRREFSRESYSQALQPVTPDAPQSLDTSMVGDVVRGDPDADGAFSGSFRVVDEAGTTRVHVRDSGRSRYGTVEFTITPDTGTTRVVDYRYAPTDAGRLRAGGVDLTDRFAFTVVDGEEPVETVTVADIPVVPARLVRADESVPVGTGVAGVAVVGDRLFVADQQNDTVAAIGIGMAAGVSAIAVGAAPTCLVSDGATLYVANGGDDTVSVVGPTKDVKRHAETDRIPVGASPFDMALSGVLLYVANSLDSTLSVIDTRTSQTVGTVDLDDGVWSIAAANDKVYVANAVDGTVTVLDADANSATVNTEIGTVDIDGVATALSAAPDGSRVFVTATRESGSRLAVIDTENDRATGDSVAVSLAAADVVFSPDGSVVYLADTHGSIAAVDTSTFEVVATVPDTTDSDIGFMAVSSDGGRLFVSSLTDDAISVIERV